MLRLQVAGRTKSLFSTMKKLLRLDSIESGGRAKGEVHDILASRCVVAPHPDLPTDQAEDLACQVLCKLQFPLPELQSFTFTVHDKLGSARHVLGFQRGLV